MVREYATPPDLAEWTGDAAPANAALLIRHASTLVEAATRNARYKVDDDGLPTDVRTAGTFLQAVCAQAAYWAANDLDPATGTLEAATARVATSKTIRGATVSYDAAAAAQGKQARADALTSLSGEAYQILNNGGLIIGAIQ